MKEGGGAENLVREGKEDVLGWGKKFPSFFQFHLPVRREGENEINRGDNERASSTVEGWIMI